MRKTGRGGTATVRQGAVVHFGGPVVPHSECIEPQYVVEIAGVMRKILCFVRILVDFRETGIAFLDSKLHNNMQIMEMTEWIKT